MPPSLRDVLPSAAALLGVPGAVDTLGLSAEGAVRRVIVLLVDGLGYHLLPQLAPVAPLLADVLAGRTGRLLELSSTFPSTTPTSLVSLGTGADPGQHGVLGFTVRVPGTATVLTHIFWGADPPPSTWQPLPTWYERISMHTGASAVLPAAFAGSGLTDAAYRGATFVGVGPREDYEALLLDVARDRPGLTFGYVAALDSAMHEHGIGSREWLGVGARIDQLIQRIVAGMPDDTTLLVTADHGGMNIAPDARFDVDTTPGLGDGVEFVAGEARMRHLHTVPGAAADVLATWTEVLGRHAVVATRADMVARGVFGAVTPAHLPRIGDVVAVCTAPIAVVSTARELPVLATLAAFHGSWTPVETAIPLIEFHR